ncbi:type II secretion system ATPase GspE [Marichromatium gracile]|uniref:Type II secretion system protein E n=1 Tax=Marichromatium gracile TaxID=1048 RepID=A0ABR5VJE2_MARGR|nr:type II secretion system ATPase GspE [Marichromatium gracile]KXX65704.1 type II secretion system protein GspE [Marichromatium gracile]
MSAAAELSAAESAALARLARAGRLTESDLARARRLAEEGGEALLPMLLRLGLVAERALAEALAAELGLELVEPERLPVAPVAEERFTPRFLKDARVLPLAERDGVLEVALANPADPFVVRAVRLAAAGPVRLAVALPSVLEQAFERLYEAAPEPAPEESGGEIDATDIEQLKDLASEAPVIRMVNLLLQRAVEARASDIHLEPFADTLRVRYRVDGVLQAVEAPPVRSSAAVISRVKIMARLNIAERRLPQDGRIPLRVQGRELDLRVSTVPTLFGESLVIRLLDKDRVRFDLDALGFDGALRARLDRVLEHPYGILLVTGPTGSGKSTTLYTLLARLNTESRKIITVEDPVEYQLAGINQIPVRPAIGMTFASALRAIVRQDPDVIMVGEMRDLETARIAVQSALTGHLVLSTLHTNDAASGATRLLEMGVEDYLLTSTVNGILAQRLVRRLCPHCRAPYRADAELAARLGLAPDALELHRAVGCDACRGTGYHGRLVIGELLCLSEAIRAAVLDHAGATEIRRIARAEGMVTMFEDGVTKARAGLTSIEEVLRVAED